MRNPMAAVRSSRGIGLGLIALALVLSGCSTPDDQRTETADPLGAMQERAQWAPELAAHIDAGNDAIRADSFAVAREHFRAATEMAPQIAAGWFGLYLTELGAGNSEAADVALERARGIAGGASLIHDQGDGGGGQ